MIQPDVSDIGRAVIYTGNRYPGGKQEKGVITSFNAHNVFVRYGSDKHSKATSRKDLEWAMARELSYAIRLAEALWEKHWKTEAPDWKPLPDLLGVLTQIDNMTTGLVRA